jgi:hypothetical protein
MAWVRGDTSVRPGARWSRAGRKTGRRVVGRQAAQQARQGGEGDRKGKVRRLEWREMTLREKEGLTVRPFEYGELRREDSPYPCVTRQFLNLFSTAWHSSVLSGAAALITPRRLDMLYLSTSAELRIAIRTGGTTKAQVILYWTVPFSEQSHVKIGSLPSQ